MYCRFESGIHPRENVVDIVCTLKDHIESLDDHRLMLEMVSSSSSSSSCSCSDSIYGFCYSLWLGSANSLATVTVIRHYKALQTLSVDCTSMMIMMMMCNDLMCT